MKTQLLVAAFCILNILWSAHASPGPANAMAKTEAGEVGEKLKAYEAGKVTLHEVTDNPDQARSIIAYYIANTNAVTLKMKLAISRCFAGFGRWKEAADLAQEYVGTYSNDWRGWSMLGGTKFLMKSYEGAIHAYTNAIRLGDDNGLVPLGGAALKLNQMDVLKSTVVPRLLLLKNSENISPNARVEMIGILSGYALKADQKDIFTNAIAGLDFKDLLERDDVKEVISKCCEHFEMNQSEPLCAGLLENQKGKSIEGSPAIGK